MKKETLYALSILIACKNGLANQNDIAKTELMKANELLKSGERLVTLDDLSSGEVQHFKYVQNELEHIKALKEWLLKGDNNTDAETTKVLRMLNESQVSDELSLKEILEQELRLADTFLDGSMLDEIFAREAAELQDTFIGRHTSLKETLELQSLDLDR